MTDIVRIGNFKIGKNVIKYNKKNIKIKDIDLDDIRGTLLSKFNIRKTKYDYYDGKNFIKKYIIYDIRKAIEERKKQYAITIKFDWRIKPNEWVSDKITSFIANTINKKMLLSKAKSASVEYAKQRTVIDSWDNIEIRNIEIIDHRLVEKTDLRDLPFFGATMTYPKLGLKVLTNTGLCGYELLLKNYKSKAKSIEHLEKFFNKDRQEGLTARDFEKFCDKHKISLYATDLRQKCAIKLIKENRNHKALIITIANQHCYEIIDEFMRERIIKRNRENTKTFKDKEEKTIKREIIYLNKVFLQKNLIMENLEKNKDYYVDAENLNDLYLNLLEQDKCYPAKYVENDVIEIHLENNKICVASKFEEMKETAKALNIPYINQSPAKLAREYFEKCTQDECFKSSTPNNLIRKYMDRGESFKSSAFNMNFKNPERDETKQNIIGIDITKQYTSIALKGDFHYIDVDDEVKTYNGENIEYGCFYYINNKVVFPMNGTGFFDYQVVSEYLNYGLITKDDIKFYFTSKKQSDVFPKFINDVYKTKHGKEMTNLLIGSLNISQSKYSTANFIVDNWNEVGYYFHLTGSNPTITAIEIKPNNGKIKKLYRIQGFNVVKKVSTNRLVYMSIVQRANLDTYKLLKYTENLPNFIPIKVKTDCIYGLYDKDKGEPLISKNRDENTVEQFGSYRLEKRIPVWEEQRKKEIRGNTESFYDENWQENPKHIASETEYYNHENILQYDRVFIEGFAGSGKSYMINALREKLGDNFSYISFTHTTSNNIDGETAHSFFGMNIDGKIDESRIRNIINTKEGIIIDEINLLPNLIYRVLCSLPKHFKIYGFGDFRQIPSIEENPITKDSQCFKHLFDCNIIRLKKQCRNDAEFANACIKYHDTEDFESISKFLQNKVLCETEFNIVKTNKMRKYINMKYMNKHKTSESKLIKPSKDNDYSQDMYLYPGLPLIATKNSKEKTYFNNEIYIVESINPIGTEQKTLKISNKNINSIRIKQKQMGCIRKEDKIIDITMNVLKSSFSPVYALTAHKTEGMTINFPYTIHEFEKMDKKIKYTCLTRASDYKYISIR